MGDVEDGVVGNDGMGGCGGVVVVVVGAGRVSSVDAVGGRERVRRRVAECYRGVHGGCCGGGRGGGRWGEGVVVYC